MEQVSKSFRATLPHLDDTQLESLRRWTQLSCAAGLVFREGKQTVLIATRERARTKEAFMLPSAMRSKSTRVTKA